MPWLVAGFIVGIMLVPFALGLGRLFGLYTIVREAGLPSRAVLDELAAGDYDLVVMGTRGGSSIVKALLGSNTAEVLRRSPVPVLAVKVKGEGLPILRAILEEIQKPAPNPALSS